MTLTPSPSSGPAPGRTAEPTGDPDTPPGNRVLLRGRVTSAPRTIELPSGSSVVVLRVSVPREERTPMVRGSRQTVDWVDCAAWGSRVRRSVSRWREGDVVEVDGALRRRFRRGEAGASTRLEVEVLAGRILERAG